MRTDVFKDDILSDKAVLVTGGGGGLGRELATALAKKGATVHICGRRGALLDEAARDIAAATGGTILPYVCDIRDSDSVEAMVADIWAHGPLTGLVNNAAANFISPSKDLSARALRAVTSTVMDGSFNATMAVGKRWIAEGRPGSIVSNLVTWVWSGSNGAATEFASTRPRPVLSRPKARGRNWRLANRRGQPSPVRRPSRSGASGRCMSCKICSFS